MSRCPVLLLMFLVLRQHFTTWTKNQSLIGFRSYRPTSYSDDPAPTSQACSSVAVVVTGYCQQISAKTINKVDNVTNRISDSCIQLLSVTPNIWNTYHLSLEHIILDFSPLYVSCSLWCNQEAPVVKDYFSIFIISIRMCELMVAGDLLVRRLVWFAQETINTKFLRSLTPWKYYWANVK